MDSKYGWKNIIQEFRLKNINETKKFFTEEIEQNELMSRKHKTVQDTFVKTN